MDLLDHLRRIAIFSHLSPRNMVALAAICEERAVPTKARLTQQAEPGVTLFIIDQGEAIVHRVDENGMQRPVNSFEAGDYFGAASLFLGEPRDATVTATTDMRVWMIRRGPFMALLDETPSMRRELNVPPEIEKRLRAPRFDWLDQNEWVVLFSRRHWLWFVRKAWAATLLLLAYVVSLALLYRAGYVELSWRAHGLAPAILYAIVTGWVLFDWRDDYFVVTNRRITHRERQAFVYESRNETPLDRVQNINMQSNPAGALLRFATITIETAADVGSMVFPGVPRPEAFQEIVWEQINRSKASKRAVQRDKIRDALAEHTDLGPIESTTPEGDETDLDTPIDHTPDEPQETEPSGEETSQKKRGLADWFSDIDLIPRTRVETEDSIVWRKHWIFLVIEVTLPVLATAFAVLLAALGFMGDPEYIVSRIGWWPWLWSGLAVPAIVWLWWTFDDWGNDLYIVTDERIVDIEKRPFFLSSTRREASLGAIQNVQLNVPNLMAATFGYGNVVVQTAGAGEFTFDRVPRPHQVQSDIFRRMHAFRRRQEEREAIRRRAELAEWFGVYEEMRGEAGPTEPGEEPKPRPIRPAPIEVTPPECRPPLPETPPPPPDPDVPPTEGGRIEM